MTKFENSWGTTREKVWLENSLSQSAQVMFEPNLLPYDTPTILKFSHSTPACL